MTQMDIRMANELIWVMVLWVIVYALDYTLTIIGARLYRSGAQDHVVFQGSYELTPVFREDVDAMRLISPRFLRYLGSSVVLILLVWLLDIQFLGEYIFFSALVGALFLREAPIYLRHIRNIVLFVLLRNADSVTGRIEYSRWVTLKVSAIELFSFAGFYVLLFLLDRSWFFLGGAVGCLVVGVQHFTMSTGESETPPPREETGPDFGPFQ